VPQGLASDLPATCSHSREAAPLAALSRDPFMVEEGLEPYDGTQSRLVLGMVESDSIRTPKRHPGREVAPPSRDRSRRESHGGTRGACAMRQVCVKFRRLEDGRSRQDPGSSSSETAGAGGGTPPRASRATESHRVGRPIASRARLASAWAGERGGAMPPLVSRAALSRSEPPRSGRRSGKGNGPGADRPRTGAGS
jgi:hypothetical protein